MGATMAMDYTILPDGSIFKLSCPADYVCASQIIQDEVGDMGDLPGSGDGAYSFVSLSVAET